MTTSTDRAKLEDPELGADIDTSALDPAALDADDRADAAKARRAARKAARAATPPPERDASFDHLSLDDLRRTRADLADEETRVSYWRRIIQARLDVVRSDISESTQVADLTRVLTEARASHRRVANLSVFPVGDIPPLPDLAEVWARQANPADPLALQRLIDDLERAERELSFFRVELHRNIDAVTTELIARYREQPLLALQILPHDPLQGP